MSAAALLPDSPWVIRRERLEHAAAIRDVLEGAEAAAAGIRAAAEAEAEDERRRGFEEGLRAGQAEAAGLLIAAAAESEAFLAAREAELTQLVFALAARLVGSLPEEERAARLLATALGGYRADAVLTLRTDTDGIAPLRRAVAELGFGHRVHVEGDPGLGPGQCTLVHERGQAAIGLADQFRALLAQAEGAA